MDRDPRKRLEKVVAVSCVSVTLAAVGEEVSDEPIRTPDTKFPAGASAALAPAAAYYAAPPHGPVDPNDRRVRFAGLSP